MDIEDLAGSALPSPTGHTNTHEPTPGVTLANGKTRRGRRAGKPVATNGTAIVSNGTATASNGHVQGPPEMVTPVVRASLTKQGYKVSVTYVLTLTAL